MKRKIHNIWFIYFLIICLLFAIGSPIINRYYLKPIQWKKKFYKMYLQNNTYNASDTQIKQFSECLYAYFKENYKSINNFPTRENYNYSDKSAFLNCTINYLISDSTKKSFCINNFDKIIREMK